MVILLLILWSPIVVAVAVALAVRYLRLRAMPTLDRGLALRTLLAGGVPALGLSLLHFSGLSPSFPLILDVRLQMALPLALGVLAVILLMIPARSTRPAATALVSRRTVTTFLAPGWILGTLAITAAILALTIAAGMASTRDSEGRFTEYWITLGTTGTSMGTGIYGWHYSLPALGALAVLLVESTIAWWLIPRPAWGDDLAHDAAVRRLRAANIARVTCGALLVHLSYILQSLGSTASLKGGGPTSELGVVSAGTPFAALGPALYWAAGFAFTAGLAFWILTALTALPGRTRGLATGRAS